MKTPNSIIKEKLEYLANFPETDYPFVTLYMNIHSHELFEQAEENRIFLKDSFLKKSDQIKKEKDKESLISFKNDEEKIRNYINNELKSEAHGLAIFACDKLGIFEAFQSLMPFDNNFVVNSFPYLKDLAYQANEYENTLVIMLDAEYSRIFEVKFGGFVITETNLHNMLHRFHKQGGWSQLRYQRHIENQVLKHYKETANTVIELTDEKLYSNIILVGQEQEIKNFEEHLPKKISTKIISIDSLQMRENINKIMQTIIDDLHKNNKKAETEIVEDVIGKAKSNNLASIKLQDIADFAESGRINSLVITKNIIETDLIERIIKSTVKNNGYIEIVEDNAASELEKVGKIAAYLRY